VPQKFVKNFRGFGYRNKEGAENLYFRKTEEVRPPRCPDDMAAMGFENSWPRIWRSNNDAQVINEMIRAMEEQRARNTRQWEVNSRYKPTFGGEFHDSLAQR
jgi:hypothetical protein